MVVAVAVNDLTDEQIDVVQHPGNVFVVACPGSGKTRTLTYKIAAELSALPAGKRFVIAITYTHKAADEIEERLTNLGVDTSRLWIGTIHSFCLEWILKPYAGYHPQLSMGFSVVNSHETELILDRLCRKSGISTFDCGFYFTGATYELACLDSRKHASIHQVLDAYFNELRDSKRIDFEMILWYAFELVSKKPAICQILSNIFEFIAIDEYQDTKRIQYSILMSIVKAGKGETRTLIVGDPNQEIFTSLGGYAMEIQELRNLIDQPIDELHLTKNFRSSIKVVDFFEKFNAQGTEIESASKDKDYPSRITFNQSVGVDGLAAEIARLIQKNVNEFGISPSEICVLAPWWVHLASMTRSLVGRLPQYDFNGPGLVPFSRDDDNFWFKVARIALTDSCPQMYVRRLRWAQEILSDLDHCGFDTSLFTPRIVLRTSNSISIAETDGLEYLAQYFDQLMHSLSVDYRSTTSLFDQYTAFFASSQARIDRLDREGMPFARDIAIFRRVFRSKTGITVSTVHGVKGGEFDTVIAYGLLDGILPHFSDPDQEGSANKLLYVIGSRARKNIHLIAEVDRPRRRFDTYSTTPVLARTVYNYDSDS